MFLIITPNTYLLIIAHIPNCFIIFVPINGYVF